MTAASTSRCSSPSRWWATSSASSRPRVPSAATSRMTGAAGDKPEEGNTPMEARARARDVRGTPMKARRVLALIRGLPADQAQAVLQFAPQAASETVGKVLASAIANADHIAGRDRGMLWVSTAYVDEGPPLRRFRARARGGGSRINKRTSHITVIVSDDSEGGNR